MQITFQTNNLKQENKQYIVESLFFIKSKLGHEGSLVKVSSRENDVEGGNKESLSSCIKYFSVYQLTIITYF